MRSYAKLLQVRFFVVSFNIYIEVNCGAKFLRWCLRKLKVYMMYVFTECKALDAICTESLTSLSVTWMPFTDPESQVVE